MKRFYAAIFAFLPFLFPQASQAQVPLEKCLLWEITGNGLSAPSYLYGTMHVGDKRAHHFSDATTKAFDISKGYAGELNLDEVDQLKVLEMMKLPEGQSLRDHYSDEEWKRLENYFQSKLHINVNDFVGYNTFFLYSLSLQSSFKNQKGQAVDMYFFKEAKRMGKDLGGLEKVEEQMAAINTLSIEEQRKMLLDMIDDNKEVSKKAGEKSMDRMIKYYRKGDLNKLVELADDSEMSSNFEQNLLTTRNHNMADRMVPLMEKQSTFVAVGALHLPGDEGVINLLREKGYKVEALK